MKRLSAIQIECKFFTYSIVSNQYDASKECYDVYIATSKGPVAIAVGISKADCNARIEAFETSNKL